ncbi:hypothetical protein H4W33_002407 [Kibdelosporangium phytohabitans]|uniref:Uncharacterized protein n=1 Tax=Kibdelosporangium phytohabitans TaxID=860235 RepID=A0A0N9I2K2_9PSEU|nr:hypothetical protein AOZ06_38265 [Kibdelosporangium phytohabitans]MBE1463395.1 hypothetical protein [Kibdelosporangium phytohabitans]
MTGFTRDGSVQRSTYGKRLTMTADFGDQPAAGVPAGCVRAETRGDRTDDVVPVRGVIPSIEYVYGPSRVRPSPSG